MTNPSINKPLAACRGNYGSGFLQAVNRTHLHWWWTLYGVGTPVAKHDCPNGTLAGGPLADILEEGSIRREERRSL